MIVFVIISSLLLLWCATNIQFTFFYSSGGLKYTPHPSEFYLNHQRV
jgi:hypothetical protein